MSALPEVLKGLQVPQPARQPGRDGSAIREKSRDTSADFFLMQSLQSLQPALSA